MCLTYIEADHRLCAKSLILNYSLLEVFILANKKDILFLGLFVLIFYSGGEGIFSLFKQSVGFLFYLFIDFFFLPFALKEALTKLIMKMSGDHVVLFA